MIHEFIQIVLLTINFLSGWSRCTSSGKWSVGWPSSLPLQWRTSCRLYGCFRIRYLHRFYRFYWIYDHNDGRNDHVLSFWNCSIHFRPNCNDTAISYYHHRSNREHCLAIVAGDQNGNLPKYKRVNYVWIRCYNISFEGLSQNSEYIYKWPSLYAPCILSPPDPLICISAFQWRTWIANGIRVRLTGALRWLRCALGDV